LVAQRDQAGLVVSGVDQLEGQASARERLKAFAQEHRNDPEPQLIHQIIGEAAAQGRGPDRPPPGPGHVRATLEEYLGKSLTLAIAGLLAPGAILTVLNAAGLVAVDVEGTAAYVLREEVDALEASLPSEAVRFLPGHDQWMMGPGTKNVHVIPSSRRDLMTRKANPVILGGVVCGTWARKGDELTVTWLDERPRPNEAIEQETDLLVRDRA
jgi:hypothetical protein